MYEYSYVDVMRIALEFLAICTRLYILYNACVIFGHLCRYNLMRVLKVAKILPEWVYKLTFAQFAFVFRVPVNYKIINIIHSVIPVQDESEYVTERTSYSLTCHA